MFERFAEIKSRESKGITAKLLAKKMLEEFRMKYKKGGETATVTSEKLVHKRYVSELESGTGGGIEEEKPIEPIWPKAEATARKQEQKQHTDKGTYESIVTNNYFEGYDKDLELDGNPELKEQIKQNIIQAEKLQKKQYEKMANDLGVSVEELKRKLQSKIEEMIRKAHFFRATHLSVLDRIMNVDGRWKSQFETATSNGTLDPRYRAMAEMKMFGFNKSLKKTSSISGTLAHDEYEDYETRWGTNLPEEAIQIDKEKRAIYGYFSDEEHGAINDRGKIPPPTSVSHYGAINIKIKKERALQKATITFHDSLDPSEKWPPTPATRPHFTSFSMEYKDSDVVNRLDRPSIVNWGESYTEVQYHGGLTMDDVESIHVSTHNGLEPIEIKELRGIFKRYKDQHPESTIQLIEF